MVIFCIGTPEVTGDSVAPIVGDLLLASNVNAYVYGNSDYPITGSNITEYRDIIAKQHSGEPIIAIDSALGAHDEVGCIKVVRGGVSPGNAVGKSLSKVGDIGILAQVGIVSDNPLPTLLSVPYDRVIALAHRCHRLVLDILSGKVSFLRSKGM